MKSYLQTPGRIRQKSLFVAKGKIASIQMQLTGLIGRTQLGDSWGMYLTDNMKRDLSSALAYVNRTLHSFNREVGWPCKDDKE